MILVLTKKHLEKSSMEVIHWIKYYNGSCVRLNFDDFLKNISYSSLELNTEIPKGTINICWLRRTYDPDFIDNILDNSELNRSNYTELSRYLYREISTLSGTLLGEYKNCKWLSHPRELRINKLDVLKRAKNNCLNIPDTIITSEKEVLKKFAEKHKAIITKCISEVSFFNDGNDMFSLKTAQVAKQEIENLPNNFFPSLFQQLLEKDFEIRAFYLNKEFYSMAIFSQEDEQTAVDFRNYNIYKPNRVVPFSLPRDIKTKLSNLMDDLNLTTGSIDLVFRDETYYFLEVNPVGQFGMVSHPCNYFLEEKIAKYLMSNDHN